MTNKNKIIPRFLDDRSKLVFYFQKVGELTNYTGVKLPFFENPEISESRKANYRDHSIISRSSNLYTYLNSDSRKINLTFYMTLPHILEVAKQFNKYKVIYENTAGKGGLSDKSKFLLDDFSEKEPQKENVAEVIQEYLNKYKEYTGLSETVASVFSDAVNSDSISQQVEKNAPNSYAAWAANAFPATVGLDIATEAVKAGPLALLDDVFSKDGVSSKNPTAIAILMFWINTIRASVINNASAPTYGPPIIKLRHGIMYQNIPCICKNYSIETVEEAGYDLATLLPRRLKISLNLEEIKYSNLPFKPNFSTGGEGNPDGVAGWESLENFGTLDPGI